ncbi:hypothetical protein BSKO_03315 [Bryopsis sp. KO-2023]|nr:hypothetical protein BSKO_03315 [Bryopsis sp. KO-2023]
MADSRPSPLYLDAKWDKVIDLSMRRVVYSGLATGLAGLILTRSGSARMAFLSLGVGFGAGTAYEESTKEMEAIFKKDADK